MKSFILRVKMANLIKQLVQISLLSRKHLGCNIYQTSPAVTVDLDAVKWFSAIIRER